MSLGSDGEGNPPQADQSKEALRSAILSAETHAQIFGEDATRDRRALKRSYARLIKKFTPEADAECFRRIRDEYETLSALFDLSLLEEESQAGRPTSSGPAKSGEPSPKVDIRRFRSIHIEFGSREPTANAEPDVPSANG